MRPLKWMAFIVLGMTLVFGGCKSEEKKAVEPEAEAESSTESLKKSPAKEKTGAAKADKKKATTADKKKDKVTKSTSKDTAARKKSDPSLKDRAARTAKHADGGPVLRPEAPTDDKERALGPRKDLPPPPAARPAPPVETAKDGAKKEQEAPKAKAIAQKKTIAPFSGKPLEVDHLLSLAEIVSATGTKVRLQKDHMEGIPLSAQYNNVYFREKKAHKFGVSMQVWQEGSKQDARWRFDQMAKSFPNVTENRAVTEKTFFAYWGDLYHLVFLEWGDRKVVSVSCGNHICTPETLLQVAMKVHDRVSSK